MKKTFQIIGLISLTLFSFFITDKTVTVVSEMDEIMMEIKAKKDEYKSDSIDATVEDNKIIPGVNGKKVNINKSYKNMKTNGYFSEKLFVYDYTKPKISLSDNIDKYIIKGNPSKRMISLIFILKGDNDINSILTTLNNYKIKATFFIDYTWFENNTDKIKEIINYGHILSPYMEDYNNSDFEWMDIILKKVDNQKNIFCFNKDESIDNLNACASRGIYTIKPTIISENMPLVDIKNKIESGSLFILNVNKELKRELSSIIIYIKSKGYELTNLEEHVLE